MADCCIIGGGIVGLSIARELAGRGHSVRVLARERRQDTASWAAAGIFPPAPESPMNSPGDALTAWSDRLHREWARELRAETGIDTGLRACGGLHLCGDPQRLDQLDAAARSWRQRGVDCESLDAAAVADLEPALAGAVARGSILAGYVLAAEMQMRPPRHLEALERSCERRGVVITHEATVREILVHSGRAVGVVADVAGTSETVRAETFVLAAGAWSGGLADSLGLRLETRPIRGQIALVRLPRAELTRVVNRGLDYLVPRADGTLLLGSTIEDVGFDRSTAGDVIERLMGMARDLLGAAGVGRPERSWAGLRPGTIDGLPTIGRCPACDNAFVAAGHFRAGLHQSTGTAVLIADLIESRVPTMDVAPFAPGRPAAPPGKDSVAVWLERAAAEA
jgi:glycine oxidase